MKHPATLGHFSPTADGWWAGDARPQAQAGLAARVGRAAAKTPGISNRRHEVEDDKWGPPRAPQRVMQIMSELAAAADGLSLARLAEQSGLPKTTLFSLLRSLEQGGFVVSESGHHRLGPEAFKLAAAINKHGSFSSRLRLILEWLHGETDETCLLGIPAADWSALVFADVIESSSSLRFTARVGAERQFYSTSVGLALLAFAPADQQRRYLARVQFEKFTPSTVGSVPALQKLIQRIRRDGYVINSGSVAGATAIGAPVFGTDGAVAASISVAGPAARIEQDVQQIVERTIEAGRRMSRELGYGGAYPRKVSAATPS